MRQIPKQEKQILSGISGSLEMGELCALMGPSGTPAAGRASAVFWHFEGVRVWDGFGGFRGLGSRVGLKNPGGAGKTSLLNVLAGRIRTSSLKSF